MEEYSSIIGNSGRTVEKNENPISRSLCLGTYSFLINLEIHAPNATAKAPMNIPTGIFPIPSHVAPIAAAPAPTVHNGQWARTGFAIANPIIVNIVINFFIVTSS